MQLVPLLFGTVAIQTFSPIQSEGHSFSTPPCTPLPTLAPQELLNLDADQRITSEQLKTYVQDSSTDAITSEGASVSHPADGRESRTTWEVCRSPATMADEEEEEVPTTFWDLDDDLLEDNEDPRCLAAQ